MTRLQALGSLLTTVKGRKPKVLHDSPAPDRVPYIDLSAVEEGTQRQWAERQDARVVPAESLVMVWDGARSGWVGLTKFEGALGSTLAVLQSPLDKRYMAAFLKAHFLDIRSNQRGSGIPHVNPEYLNSLEIPVRSESDQERVARAADAILSKTESTEGHLAAAHRILDRFRTAILTAACSGRLTAEWRDDHPQQRRVVPEARSPGRTRQGRLWGGGSVRELTPEERASIPEVWAWLKVAHLGSDSEAAVQIGPMSMRSSEFVTAGVPVLNVGSVQDGWIDSTKLNYLPPDRARVFDRYRLKEGDVLFTRSGTVGRCAVVTAQHDGSLMTFHLLRVRPDPSLCRPHYLWCAFNGSITIRRQREEAQIGTTRAGFNTSLLAALDVPVPPATEQDEILRRVDRLLALANEVQTRVESVRQSVGRGSLSALSWVLRDEPSAVPSVT